MTSAREQVMAAVRAALARPSPAEPAASTTDAAAIRESRARIVPQAPAELAARFGRELEALAADLLVAPDLGATIAQLRDHLRAAGAEKIAAASSDALTDAVATGLEAAGVTITRLEELAPDARRAHLAEVDTVITGADYGLAATGTLVCTPHTLPDRIAAGLPRRHVALLAAERLLPDTATLFERHAEVGEQALLFISGPSRTADVEKTLVLGAHGPAALTVVLIGAARSA